jgi:hypothetical protein
VAFKPNYRQQRNDRNRVKEERKKDKLLKQQEAVEKRKAARETESETETPAEEPQN